MKKKFSKILGVCLATALLLSLVVVAAPVMVAAPPDADVEAAPGGIFTLSDQADGNGTACWNDIFAAQVDDWSVELDYNAAGGSVYLEFVPEPGTTVANLGDIVAGMWSFWYHLPNTVGNGPVMELRFVDTAPCVVDPGGAGHVDITIDEVETSPTLDAWTLVPITTGSSCIYFGNDPVNGTAFFDNTSAETLAGVLAGINGQAEMVAHLATADDWELVRVRVELGYVTLARNCYIDDITIDGEIYDVEHVGPLYYLEPDIAYNVKTATETFTLMGPCGPVDETSGTFMWDVTKGCGVGAVSVSAGGNLLTATDNNSITIRMNTKGDAHICVVYDEGGAAAGPDPIEVCAEKKWGEIQCTELTKGTLVADEACVTELVKASFLWDDCTSQQVLPADDAKVDWWLMDIGALAAVEALEAELGNDPCDADGGCGGYAPGFFSYDVNGNGSIDPVTEVFDSPRDAMLAIYAANMVVDHDKSYINVIGNTDETTSSGVDGTTTVMVHIESPTSAILATLTDYPIDKHGENTVCVQHETWVITPPPVHEKLPNIVWAGEKDVIEWRLPAGVTIGTQVAFYLEDPSVGTLESMLSVEDPVPYPGFAIKDSAWADVESVACGDYTVARVIIHSDKQGKSNVVGLLFNDTWASGGTAPEVLLPGQLVSQQGFIIYFLAFEEVELVNMGDPDNDEAWEGAGVVSSALGVNDSSMLRLRVKGYFTDPVRTSTRPEKPQDQNGDGITDEILPAGRWILPDDYPNLAFGKLLWDLMDTPVDDIVSWLDEGLNKVETLGLDDELKPPILATPAGVPEEVGAYGDGTCFEYPLYDATLTSAQRWAAYLANVNAFGPVIGPFSKLEPVNADGTSWDILQQPDVLADGRPIDALLDEGTTDALTAGCRTTVVPDGLTTPEDANMPPAEILFVVTDGTGLLTPVNKGGLYQITDTCNTDTGVVYTNPYYWQEIPANLIIPPLFGSGLAGYEWDSWQWATNLAIDGPYRFWDGLQVWIADEENAMNIFGLSTVPTTLKAYTDNRGEAWVDFTQRDFAGSTIEALASYPYLQGDHVSVVSNEVEKTSEDEKDIKLFVDDVDPSDYVNPLIRKILYTFVRNYDGTPATCEKVEWAIDGPYGIIESLLANTDGACTNDCYDAASFDWDCEDSDISTDGRTAENCTRLMTPSEIAHFVAEEVFTSAAVAEDYAISGIVVLSSWCENVDVPIVIYDCWGDTIRPMARDKMVTDFCGEPVDDPWIYDVNDDDVISKAEALAAVADYFGGDITKAFALEVIALYFA